MDWKLRSLWSWSRPASEAHQSDTAVPNEEGFSSEDYISEEEKGPRVNLVNWSGKSPRAASERKTHANDTDSNVKFCYAAVNNIISNSLNSSAGLLTEDVNRAVDLLSNIDDHISRSDLLVFLINDHSFKKTKGVEPLFQELISRHSEALFKDDNDGNHAAYRACIRYSDDAAALQLLREMHKCRPEFIHQTSIEASRQRTYLHLATEMRWDRVVGWLLERNVGLELKDKDGKMAWEISFDNNDGVVMSMLATYHVTRQVADDESRESQSNSNDLENFESNKIESSEVESNKAGGSAIKSNEVESNEVKSKEVKSDEVESNEAGGGAIKSNEVESNEVKSKEIKSDEAKSKDAEGSAIKSNEVENNQVENNQVENNQVENNQVENNQVENNQVENNQVKSNEVESNEVKNRKVRRHWFRVRKGFHSVKLEKHFDPARTLGFTNKWTFKLFTISENKASFS
jgi:hypothetical protein